MTEVTRANVEQLLDDGQLQIGIMGAGGVTWMTAARHPEHRVSNDSDVLDITVRLGDRIISGIHENHFNGDGTLKAGVNMRALG